MALRLLAWFHLHEAATAKYRNKMVPHGAKATLAVKALTMTLEGHFQQQGERMGAIVFCEHCSADNELQYKYCTGQALLWSNRGRGGEGGAGSRGVKFCLR